MLCWQGLERRRTPSHLNKKPKTCSCSELVVKNNIFPQLYRIKCILVSRWNANWRGTPVVTMSFFSLCYLKIRKNSEFLAGNSNAKCKYNCKHKIFAQTQNFRPNLKFLPKPNFFARTHNFCLNLKFSPKLKIFSQT